MSESLRKPSPDKENLRDCLVAVTLEWERVFGVAPTITSAVSEYDAACLVGHTDESYGEVCVGRTDVTRGCDFILTGFGIRLRQSSKRKARLLCYSCWQGKQLRMGSFALDSLRSLLCYSRGLGIGG